MIAISCARILKVHKNHFTYRYWSNKSLMRETGAASKNEMLNPALLMEGSCRATPVETVSKLQIANPVAIPVGFEATVF